MTNRNRNVPIYFSGKNGHIMKSIELLDKIKEFNEDESITNHHIN